MAHEKMDFGAALKDGGAVVEPFDVTLNKVSRRVAISKHDSLTLLDEVSLYFKPGTMTLVLGAPGCGKTTLFKVLANHGGKKKNPQTGQALFNGKPPSRKSHHKSVAYVTQEDTHFPTLTVRETFQFSLDCKAGAMPDQAKAERVDMLLRLLDLKHVQDTLVGNDLIRGISGGQRKRVTIGVALTASPSLILMDEPTTGLDANTALEVITSIRSVCDSMKTTVVASLLQPSPEICNLFDNLVILSKGRVAYFGPYKNAVPYFSRHGLEGGKFQSDPEFLQEAVEFSYKYSEKSTDQMVNIYRESPEYQDAMRIVGPEVAIPEHQKEDPNVPIEHTYATSFAQQIRLNMKREIVMIKRDLATLRGRFMKKVIMGLVAGSLFFNLTDGQAGLRTRLAVLFFSNLFLAFGNVGIISPFYRERDVFYVQREQKYYSPLTYVLSKVILEFPFIILECIIFGTIIYWMVGLNSDGGRFIFFLLILMASDLFAITFCRFASTFIAQEQVAAGMVPAIFGTLVMFTGFVIPPPSIPNWWIWIYYLSPFHYSLEACMINELVGETYHCKASEMQPPPYNPLFSMPYPQGFSNSSVCPITRGEQELHNLKMHTEFGWRWAHLAIVLSFSVFFTLITFIGAVRVNHTDKLRKSNKKGAADIKLEVTPEKVDVKAEGAFMSWEDLSYAVDVKKGKHVEQLTLLDGITGYVRPGMLMALMGPSGAGKSTLLDVLGNRKTGGHTKGKILVNGHPRDQYFSRFSAYVEQMDMLMPLATVYETVLFSAQVRLPRELTKDEIEMRIKDTLHVLDLDSIQNSYAGGLSMEQRKRLTIAVELVADPRLLFLDEPTSGLDSQAAMKVMDVVKRVADTGRAVICTIHQPSLTVFSYFDHLLLLKRGGRTVYFGPTGNDCHMVLDYFSSIGWDCAPKRNPADFILDAAAITADNEGALVGKQQDPETAYKGSALKREMESHVGDIPAGFVAPSYNKKYASSFGRQVECNLRREWANVRRRIEDLRARFMRSLMLGIIIGTLFLQLDHSQSGASDRFGLLFFVLIIMGTSANNAVPNVVNGRAVFYREQAAGAYRAFAYLIGIITTEIPITLITSLILSILTYFLAGLTYSANHFFFYAWMVFLYGSVTMAFVIFLSLATPNGEIAAALAGVFTSVFSLFAGFIITRPNIPNYWIWMYYLNLMHYPLEAIVVNEMENNWFGCHNGKGAIPIPIHGTNETKLFCPITDGNQSLKGLDFHASDKFHDMGISIAFWFALVMFSFLALRFIRHIKR